MTGDCHVRFYESRGVRFPPATHQSQHIGELALKTLPELMNYWARDSRACHAPQTGVTLKPD